MERIFFVVVMIIFIALLFLQLSCSTGRRVQESDERALSGVGQTGEGLSGEIEAGSEKDLLLVDRHTNNGIGCNDCHIEETDDNDVPTAVCESCHEGYKEPSASASSDVINPHYAHMVYYNCGDCHHAHRPSEDQCQACHAFDFDIP